MNMGRKWGDTWMVMFVQDGAEGAGVVKHNKIKRLKSPTVLKYFMRSVALPTIIGQQHHIGESHRCEQSDTALL